jgi:hypothetical protein
VGNLNIQPAQAIGVNQLRGTSLLRDAHLPMVDMNPEVRQQRGLHIAHGLLRIAVCLHQQVDLLNQTALVRDDSRAAYAAQLP